MQVFRKYLTRQEQSQLLKPMQQTTGWVARRDYAAAGLMLACGPRVSTLVQLTVRDAQDALAHKELSFRPEISKGRNGYAVALSSRAAGHLRTLLAIRRELGLSLEPDAPLIVARVRNRRGEGMTARAMQLRMQVWREKSGLGLAVTPHWLRHSLGQRLVRESTAANPLVAAQRALGHRSLTSTAIYTAPTREEMARAMEEAS